MSSQTPSSVLPPVIADEGNTGDDDAINSPNPNRWFFDKSKIENTPSRRSGIDADKELAYRQQSANFIQDIGQRLQVNQLCINTAIVYMHRFYMFHSFSHFHRNSISTASIFLAAKVEEQPRKLDHVIKVSHYCLHKEHPIDVKSEAYQEQSAELVMNENILLQTLGFDVAIDHPHTHVVKCCQLVRASKDLAQTSYFMATNSLHLTTMCLQYKPTVVACVCIHLACKWSSWEIPRSKEGKDWWKYVDDTCTADQLEQLTTDFLTIFNKSPSRLKRKIISLNAASGGPGIGLLNVPALAGLGFDPAAPAGQQSTSSNRSRSRSPSPKRQRVAKPGEVHGAVLTKPHSGQVPPHHGMRPSVPNAGGHHGAPLPPNSKHGQHPPMKPHLTKPSHPPSAKEHHQQQFKDPHHPHYQQQQQAQQGKNPFGATHGHHPVAHYPHGTSNRVTPHLAQGQYSHSSQGHSQQGQKPTLPAAPGSTSGTHHPPPPYPSSTGSSSSKPAPSKPPNMSQTNPYHLNLSPYNEFSNSQPNPSTHTSSNSSSQQFRPKSAPVAGQNKIPPSASMGKNHNPSHMQQQHVKKPYEQSEYAKRDSHPGSTAQQQQHARPRTAPADCKADNRPPNAMHSTNHLSHSQPHRSSSSRAHVPIIPLTPDKTTVIDAQGRQTEVAKNRPVDPRSGEKRNLNHQFQPTNFPPNVTTPALVAIPIPSLQNIHSSSKRSSSGTGTTNNNNNSAVGGGGAPTIPSVPSIRTTSLFSPEFKEEAPSIAIPGIIKAEPSVVDGNQNVGSGLVPSAGGGGTATSVPSISIRPPELIKIEPNTFRHTSSHVIPPQQQESSTAVAATADDEKESHKHKKKKKEKHKHKDKEKEKHKEEKKHKKDKHKDKEKNSKHKHKDKDKSPTFVSSQTMSSETDPMTQKIKIKLTINKDEKGGLHQVSSKRNANLRQ